MWKKAFEKRSLEGMNCDYSCVAKANKLCTTTLWIREKEKSRAADRLTE